MTRYLIQIQYALVDSSLETPAISRAMVPAQNAPSPNLSPIVAPKIESHTARKHNAPTLVDDMRWTRLS